ncbi:MAG: phage holin family protein [Rhodocyclaceae bacterium]|nr:phage holin family protein [Rhodocyclaceae bacterium]
MHEKDPSTYGVITYLWVIGLSAWGGLVSFYRRVKAGESSITNFAELIGEIATSAFAGLITFWLCEAAQFKPLITAALVGISGHMGSRALWQLEHWAKTRFGGLK